MTLINNFFTKAFAFVVVGHALTVESTRMRTLEDSKFSRGSADDLVMDALVSGDIIVFNRKWYKYHLPTAAMIKLYQIYYKTDYDHCGVIILNDKGEPYVFEKTPFGGYKMRHFEPRLLHSQAQSVTAILLFPRQRLPTKQKNQSRDKISEELVNNKTGSSEIFSFVKCFYSFMTLKEPSDETMVNPSTTSSVCMNAQFILDTLYKLDITPSSVEFDTVSGLNGKSIDSLTLGDILDRKVTFQQVVQPIPPQSGATTTAEKQTPQEATTQQLAFNKANIKLRMQV
jgi:hypothetical protein